MTTFVDANNFLRFLRDDVPTQSPACKQLFLAVAQGSEEVWTSELIVAEVVFVLERVYKEPRANIARTVLPLTQLQHLDLAGKALYPRVFDLYETVNLSYVDCHSAALVEAHPTREMYSYDQGYKRITTITRREPR
jgi:predicted nucleic acid-binding protein